MDWTTFSVAALGIVGTLLAGPVTESWKARSETKRLERQARRLVAGELAEAGVTLGIIAAMGQLPNVEVDSRFLGHAMWDKYSEVLAESTTLAEADYWRVWGLYSWVASFHTSAKGRALRGAPPSEDALATAREMRDEAFMLAGVLGLPDNYLAEAKVLSGADVGADTASNPLNQGE